MIGEAEAGTGPGALHASCVAWGDRGLLILGRPGSGKSRLALGLIALGCALVADDRVTLRLARGGIRASAPAALRGLVEARGLGLIRMPWRREAAVTLAIALGAGGAAEPASRLPPRRALPLLGIAVPLWSLADAPDAAAALAALRHGPPLDPDAAGEAEDGRRSPDP
jgi:HPr kinase/phosphorylase